MTIKRIGSVDIRLDSDQQIDAVLQRIADMYKDPYRVMYEFIQNSIDSANQLRNERRGKFPYPIKIMLNIDKKNKTFVILDNCKGMPMDIIRGLAQKIFDSSKKSMPWAIGKFGYGIHSFRAFFKKIIFKTKIYRGNLYEISFEKGKIRNNDIVGYDGRDDNFPFPSGTSIRLQNIDRTKFKFSNINQEKIKEAIELHCENILREPMINIGVTVNGNKFLKCEPFNYDVVEGEYLKKELKIQGQRVNVFLKITKKPMKERRPRFTCKNFRINEISNCESFRRFSETPELWDHPNLIGFIEVNDLVSPELERSDFPKTKERDLLYKEVTKLEPEIRKLLDKAIEKTKLESLKGLSTVLEDVFSQISKEDDLLFREALRRAKKGEASSFVVGGEGGGDDFGLGGPTQSPGGIGGTGGEDTGTGEGPNIKGTGDNIGGGEGGTGTDKVEDGIEVKKKKTSGFSIDFRQLGKESDMAVEVDNVIVINVDHTNFMQRANPTKTGKVSIKDGRLPAYCAQLITTYYIIARDKKRKALHDGPITENVYLSFTNVVCRAEAILNERRTELNKLIREKIKNED